jgi:hypothetical protein
LGFSGEEWCTVMYSTFVRPCMMRKLRAGEVGR